MALNDIVVEMPRLWKCRFVCDHSKYDFAQRPNIHCESIGGTFGIRRCVFIDRIKPYNLRSEISLRPDTAP